MPQITVIMPVLNGMPHLSEALASIEAQTFRDFEVILWDNASTDGTLEEAQRWIPSRLPGRVVTGEPLPLHICLARMVKEASSPFIARMDADDVCLPQRFEQQVKFLAENPSISLLGCQIECIDSRGEKLPKESWAQFSIVHEDIVTQLLFSCPFCHPSIMIRTDSVLACGNYAVPAPIEDLDLYLRLVQTARVANLSSIGLHYRIHPKSICAMASEGNRHERLAINAISQQAKTLFGINNATYLQLRNKTHPISILPLLKSMFYRAKGNPVQYIRLMGTPTFLFTGRCLTGKRDFVSKLIFRIIETFMSKASSPSE